MLFRDPNNLDGSTKHINIEKDINIDINMPHAHKHHGGCGNQGIAPLGGVMPNMGMNAAGFSQPMQGTTAPTRERVVNRTIVHEVQHTCPIHTRIVNNHVCKHTYRPVYSTSEENVVSHVQCGSCCNFN